MLYNCKGFTSSIICTRRDFVAKIINTISVLKSLSELIKNKRRALYHIKQQGPQLNNSGIETLTRLFYLKLEKKKTFKHRDCDLNVSFFAGIVGT